MYLAEIAALSAAALWALGSILATSAVREIGSITFNRLRMVIVFVMLAIYVTWAGLWGGVQQEHIWPLVLSAFVGIVFGDTALYVTVRRLGPRRAAVLFATNAPLAVFLTWFLFNEVLGFYELLGTIILIFGVMLAIVFGKRKDQMHNWEKIQGRLIVGVCWGLAAAVGQALGSIIVKPALEAGADPVVSSAIRVGISAASLTIICALPMAAVKPTGPLTRKNVALTAASGIIGMGFGMTALMIALANGDVGVVSSLASTTPVILLPFLWIKTGECPAPGAWFGAALVAFGTALIFVF
ncbi:MAG: DMT family transporter [Cohaesibacteraceae bacterium]|nr:DMT family transporter [Cohaesibacteraceae bacterium]MBL4876963.1 DMT family transporter [Cohaesibacteraceae bacterium]